MAHDIVVIRRFANEIEAHIAQADLEAHGIPSMLLRDDAGGMQPALQFLHGVRLAVLREHVEEATRLLDDVPHPDQGDTAFGTGDLNDGFDARTGDSDVRDDEEADDDDEEEHREPWAAEPWEPEDG